MVEGKLSLLGQHVYEGSCHKVHSAQSTIYWQGFVYIEGHIGQHPSMLEFARRLKSGPIEQVVADLKGSFFCIVKNAPDTYQVFVDNSGMFAAYSSEQGASRSYLKLVEFLKLGMEDVNWTNVAEFVQTANFYFNRSHFEGIRKIAFDDIFEYSGAAQTSQDSVIDGIALSEAGVSLDVNDKDAADGDFNEHDQPERIHRRRLHKQISDLTGTPSHESLMATFDGLATALANTRVCVDVTGGLDTRTVIAGLEAANVDFETSLSGMDTHQDVKLARKVAAAISKPLHVTPHCVDNLETELQPTLESLDGLKALVLTQHRILQLQNARGQRGMQLSLRGIGGELYRDFKWAQDFPFYLSRKTRFARYDRLRVEVVRLPEKLLSNQFKVLTRKARDRRVTDCARYQKHYNSQSYDLIDFHETLQNSHSRAMSVSSVDPVMTYCPLSEVYRLQHAYHCPRLLRFGSLFQKHFITRCHAPLARVKTSYGATTSTEPRYLIVDAFVLSVTNCKKLIRKLSQTYLGRSPFILKAANNDDGMRILRDSSLCQQAIDTLQRYDVLATTIKPQDIPDRFIERLIYTGWFLQRIENRAGNPDLKSERDVDLAQSKVTHETSTLIME